MDKVVTTLQRLDAAVFVAAGLGGFLGALLFVIEGHTEGLRVVLFNSVPARVQLWLLLIGVQGAFWGVSFVLLLMWWYRLLQDALPPWQDIVLRLVLPVVFLVVAAALLGSGAEGKGPDWPPVKLGEFPISNLRIFAACGVGIALVAVAGMFMVGVRARTDLAKPRQAKRLRVRRYLELQRLLDSFLLVAALILGLGTLATAALRNAYNASVGTDAFAKEYVIIYGGLYSIALAIAYAAARGGLLLEGRRIRDALAGDPPAKSSEFEDWSDARDNLNARLRLKFTGLPALGETFSVLAPLIVGAISSLLG